MIHFFDPSNAKMVGKLPELAPKVDVLLGNLEDAIQASNKEAARAGLVEVSLSSSPPDLVLSIRDDGCGFEPGQQTGAGFGLHTMRERIQQAGGRFWLESSPGQGTRVTARIPLEKEAHG